MTHRPLLAFSGLMLITTLVSVGGLLLDGRVMTGEPIWLKPFKFSVSLGIYALTWAWLLSLQRRRSRLMWWGGTLTAALACVEMVIIIGQVVRGRASHFNAETALDATLFSIMGVAIVGLWVLGMVQGAVILRERIADRPLAWALRFGIVVGLAGIGLAFLMTDPTPDQLAVINHGGSLDRIGGHAVGVADGGPGMPVTGWSTTGGDLRIPHFVGIHAMQVLPLLAVLLGRVPRLDDTTRSRIVIVGGVAYAGLTALVTWQALRGQPLISPDLWTVAAFSALVVGAAVGVRAAITPAKAVVA